MILMDLEAFRKNIENKDVKTGKLYFVNDCAFLPIHEERDLSFLTHLFFEFELKSDFKIQVLTKLDNRVFHKFEDNRYFLSDKEYSESKLNLMIEKQDFDIAIVKTGCNAPVFFKFTKK